MTMNIQEMLTENTKLREAAVKQWQDYKEGKIKERPSAKVESFDMVEKMLLNAKGDFSKGSVTVQETITSTDTVKLIPSVITGQMREAAEPEYLASKFFKKIHVNEGNSTVYVIPVVGEVYAQEIAEGGRYPESSPDFNTIENGSFEVRVRKIGCKCSITEEAITSSAWDIYGINVAKIGRAMARYKEELCLSSFTDHGHVIFDNQIRGQMPAAGTTGLAADGSYNDTLSTEDFLDMMLAMLSQDQTPTDVILHPLTWVVFARNSMIGNGMTWGALGGQGVNPWGAVQGTPGFGGLAASPAGQKFIMTPEQTQNRLPMPLTINFSPFVPFDKVNKTFDIYVINKNNVGVIAQKEELSLDNWVEPERDIRMLKARERYGVGIIDNGRGIAVARHIAVAPSYPQPPVVAVLNKNA